MDLGAHSSIYNRRLPHLQLVIPSSLEARDSLGNVKTVTSNSLTLGMVSPTEVVTCLVLGFKPMLMAATNWCPALVDRKGQRRRVRR